MTPNATPQQPPSKARLTRELKHGYIRFGFVCFYAAHLRDIGSRLVLVDVDLAAPKELRLYGVDGASLGSAMWSPPTVDLHRPGGWARAERDRNAMLAGSIDAHARSRVIAPRPVAFVPEAA